MNFKNDIKEKIATTSLIFMTLFYLGIISDVLGINLLPIDWQILFLGFWAIGFVLSIITLIRNKNNSVAKLTMYLGLFSILLGIFLIFSFTG